MIRNSRILLAALVMGALIRVSPAHAEPEQPAAPTAAQPAPSKAQSAADLRKAYQKEYAFLKAQEDSLRKRLREQTAESRKKITQARNEVDRLQGRLVSLTLNADRTQEQLREAELAAPEFEDNAERLLAMLSQARDTLVNGGVKMDEAPEDIDQAGPYLAKVYDNGNSLLERYASVRSEKGSFFLEDGAQASGTIVYVGNIASFGVSAQGAGALVPAGPGKLKIWHQPAEDTAKALANGQHPETLRVFLYESTDEAIERQKDKTTVEFIQAGGIIGWVIVGIGLAAFLMIVIRALLLLRASSRSEVLVDEISPMVAAHDKDRALEKCENTSGPVARVLAATVRNLDRDRDHLEDIVSEAVLHETPQIEKFAAAITVCAAVAPLLGLLGTVTGMIATFEIITEFGTGDPKLLSGGISEALVTTQLGLTVAVPTLLLGSLLSAWGTSILNRMEKGALQVMNVNGVGAEFTAPSAPAPKAPQPQVT